MSQLAINFVAVGIIILALCLSALVAWMWWRVICWANRDGKIFESIATFSKDSKSVIEVWTIGGIPYWRKTMKMESSLKIMEEDGTEMADGPMRRAIEKAWRTGQPVSWNEGDPLP